jgi:hypothetical protein
VSSQILKGEKLNRQFNNLIEIVGIEEQINTMMSGRKREDLKRRVGLRHDLAESNVVDNGVVSVFRNGCLWPIN